MGITDLEFKVVHKSKDGATIQCADHARYIISWQIFEKCFTKQSENIVKVSDLIISNNTMLLILLHCISEEQDVILAYKHVLAIGAILEISDDAETMNFIKQAVPAIFCPHPKKETPAEYKQRKEREKSTRPTDNSSFGMSDKNMSSLQKLKEQLASE